MHELRLSWEYRPSCFRCDLQEMNFLLPKTPASKFLKHGRFRRSRVFSSTGADSNPASGLWSRVRCLLRKNYETQSIWVEVTRSLFVLVWRKKKNRRIAINTGKPPTLWTRSGKKTYFCEISREAKEEGARGRRLVIFFQFNTLSPQVKTKLCTELFPLHVHRKCVVLLIEYVCVPHRWSEVEVVERIHPPHPTVRPPLCSEKIIHSITGVEQRAPLPFG